MRVVKQQLKAFYRGKGLKGKRLKRAVWADVGRVKANQDAKFVYDYSIEARFSFRNSPEGHAYWAVRAFRMATRRWK